MNENLKYLGRQIGLVLLVLLLGLVIFCAGLVIGYGVIGNGDPWAILSPKTWESILSKFTGQ